MMKLTTKQPEYLVERYWLYYYPELNSEKWSSKEVENTAAIVLNKLQRFERELYEVGLLSLPRYDIRDRSGQYPRFLYFEWRLEVSGYGASVIEPLCAMDLMLKLGEILQLVDVISLSAYQRIAIRSGGSKLDHHQELGAAVRYAIHWIAFKLVIPT